MKKFSRKNLVSLVGIATIVGGMGSMLTVDYPQTPEIVSDRNKLVEFRDQVRNSTLQYPVSVLEGNLPYPDSLPELLNKLFEENERRTGISQKLADLVDRQISMIDASESYTQSLREYESEKSLADKRFTGSFLFSMLGLIALAYGIRTKLR